MRKIKKMIARSILILIDELREETRLSNEDTVTIAEAIKTLTEAIKNLG